MGVDNSRADTVANSAVPLTAALEAHLRNGNLENLKENLVASYLNHNLKWRLFKVSDPLMQFDLFKELITRLDERRGDSC